MNDQSVFAIRVSGFFVAFLIGVMLSKEVIDRATLRECRTLAFMLVASSAGLAYGTCGALFWGTWYHFMVITKNDGEWMLSSYFVPFYTVLMYASALFLMRALTVSREKAIFCIGATIISGLASYIWIGSYL